MDSRYRDIVRSDAALVGYWKLDGDYIDEKNGVNGSCTSGGFISCAIGLGANMTATSGGHINITDSNNFQFGTTQDFSAELFVRPAENGRIQLYVDHRASATSGFTFYVSQSNNASVQLDGTTWLTGLGMISGTSLHHVIYSVDRDNNITTFINGVANTVSVSTTTINVSISSFLTIGSRSFTQGAVATAFNGQIDEISIYTRALTQADATARYTAFAANDRPWINTGMNSRGG